jgi:hypothetical protein
LPPPKILCRNYYKKNAPSVLRKKTKTNPFFNYSDGNFFIFKRTVMISAIFEKN